jgi:hypothetical protein
MNTVVEPAVRRLGLFVYRMSQTKELQELELIHSSPSDLWNGESWL